MTGRKTEYDHVSVLGKEATDALSIKDDGIYVDGTLGGGGHASIICGGLSDKGLFIGIDRDIEAINASRERLQDHKCKKIYEHNNFSKIKTILEKHDIKKINGGILDLGVSSYQLDNKDRGFSYMNDVSLDMRMDRNGTITAEDVVNKYSGEELTHIIRKYGEERWAARISKFIIEARRDSRIETTGQLTRIIKAAIPASARREGPHPAKRTFQALRIEVNNELMPLGKSIEDFIDIIESGGRLAVISFHSLEDRIVKDIYKNRENPCTCPKDLPVCICGKVGDVKRINKKPITASQEELKNNPRSRSAKLRILEKL